MGEGRGWCRVGQVICGHVNGLDRGDRAFVGRGNPLLKLAHFGGQRRLIAHSRWNTAEQGGHFGAGLGKAEDVIDEEENVLAFLVAEVLSLCKAGQGNAGTRAWRLVHLAVDQRHAAVAVEVDDLGVDHLVIEIVTFTGPLTDACEHRIAAEEFRDVVDQFLNQNRLADAGTAEEADLAAFCVWAEKVDDLDTGDEDLGLGGLIDEFRGWRVDWRKLLGLDRATFVNRLTDDVHDAAERFRADRDHDRLTKVADRVAANETLGGVHCDRADRILAKVLGDLKNEAVAIIVGFQRVQNVWKRAGEFNVDNGADNL